MFTGIIEEVGYIKSIKTENNSAGVSIHAPSILKGTSLGDSIAVNGICLTVDQINHNIFTADVMPETMSKTALGNLGEKSEVNLERAMPADGRFGGAIVSGHIDGTGIIEDIQKNSNALLFTIKTGHKILKYVIEKGSITIDGINLTIVNFDDNTFSVSIIPHTAQKTNLAKKRKGDMVNLENDIIGKYIEKFISIKSESKQDSDISFDFLKKNGF